MRGVVCKLYETRGEFLIPKFRQLNAVPNIYLSNFKNYLLNGQSVCNSLRFYDLLTNDLNLVLP